MNIRHLTKSRRRKRRGRKSASSRICVVSHVLFLIQLTVRDNEDIIVELELGARISKQRAACQRCLYGNTTSFFFDMEPPMLEDYFR